MNWTAYWQDPWVYAQCASENRYDRLCYWVIPFRITDPPKDAPLFSPSAG